MILGPEACRHRGSIALREESMMLGSYKVMLWRLCPVERGQPTALSVGEAGLIRLPMLPLSAQLQSGSSGMSNALREYERRDDPRQSGSAQGCRVL